MVKGRASKSAKRRRKSARPRSTARAREIETALAAFAHEVRTPLTGILALSELIATADLPERERGWAAAVKSAAEHLGLLTTLIIDGVRADARGLVLRIAPFRLRAFVDAIAATLVARAESVGLAADIAIAADLPEMVEGDAVRLRAALENLIDNAVKFTEQGRVALSVEAKTAARGRCRLTFTVADSGVGLTRAEIGRLFRPFAQANETVAQRFGGSGLGLAFVARIAKAMGGSVTVVSRRDHGSTFRFAVTLTQATGETAVAGGTPHAKPARSLRVLCAEDNPYARVVLKTVLGEFGHRADFVGTGEAAVAAVAKGGYGLVLMDLTLPGLDGIAAVRAIRALAGAAGRVPVIGISGRSEPEHIAAVHAAGMNAFLPKPVGPAALAQAIAEIAPSHPSPANGGGGG